MDKNYLPAELAAQMLEAATPAPSNTISPAGRALLDLLQEEAAEVIQAASKIKRFGPGENPYVKVANSDALAKEVGQFLQIARELMKSGVIARDAVLDHAAFYAERLSAEPKWCAPAIVRVETGVCEHIFWRSDDVGCPSCGQGNPAEMPL